MNIEQNVQFNEIEVTNNPVSITKEQEDLNNEFIEKVFDTCKSYVDSCCCDAQRAFIERCRNRARTSIITPTDRYASVDMTPDDEFIDNFKFGVIIHSQNGVYVDTPLIVRECKTCHRLSFYGSASAISTLFAIDDVNAINNGEILVSNDSEMLNEDQLIQTFEESGISGVEITELEDIQE